MQRIRTRLWLLAFTCAVVVVAAPPAVWQASAEIPEPSLDIAVRYVLETVRAFRSAYVLKVVEHLREGGIQPNEQWTGDVHAVPLPAQFVKEAGGLIDSFEIGLMGIAPLSPTNVPRTSAEADALQRLSKDGTQRMITFLDGDQMKGLSADVALVQSCVDCHNAHPKAKWHQFKKGDVLGAIVVRINRKRS